jgi:hypothetical protein
MPGWRTANSCHQAQFTPPAAARASRLGPRSLAIASCTSHAAGSATRSVSIQAPASTAGAESTRQQAVPEQRERMPPPGLLARVRLHHIDVHVTSASCSQIIQRAAHARAAR